MIKRGEWRGGNINSLPELNGFWLESSLKISPKE
jgi:bla regulator protein BlaR1